MIFPDSNKVILARGVWEQVLLRVSPAVGTKYTFYLSWISNGWISKRWENATVTNNRCSSLQLKNFTKTVEQTFVRSYQRTLSLMPLLIYIFLANHQPSLGSYWEEIFIHSMLKLMSAIFHHSFISNQMIALQKIWKMFFISYKKLFLFSRYSSFCISVFSSFSPCNPLL